MENNSDFVSPIEKHWNEAAALRGSRSRNFIRSSLELEPATTGSGLLRRRRDLDGENDGSGVSSRASTSRPSSSTGGTPKIRRSRVLESPIPATASSSSSSGPAPEGRSTPTASIPVCMAPPDVLPIYEQKQLFAAYSNRITPLQQHYHINPTSFTAATGGSPPLSNPLHSSTLHEQSSTSSSFTSDAWTSPILSARTNNSNRNSVTRTSSVSTQQDTAGSIARLSGTPAASTEALQRQASLARRHEKPVLRIDCGENNHQNITRSPMTSRVSNSATGNFVRNPVASRRPIVERVTPHILGMVPETPTITRHRKTGVHSPPNLGFGAAESRDSLRVFSNYNFSNITRKVFPLDVASDTASTISDEFFVPIKPSARILNSRRFCKRICRAEEKFVPSANEVAAGLKGTKICSKEIADWAICKSCRQDQGSSVTVCNSVLILGRFVNLLQSHDTSEIVYDEINQILVPPRRFKAVLSQQSFDYEAEFDSHDVIRAHESITHLPALSDSRINLLQLSSDDQLDTESAKDDDFSVRQPIETQEINDEFCGVRDEKSQIARELSWRNLVDIAQSERVCSHNCDQNNEFNCALALQLFSLIDQLTEELKRVEADCVELRAELSELRREKRDKEKAELKLKQDTDKKRSNTSSKNDANIYNLTTEPPSKEVSKSTYLASNVSVSLLQQELSATQMPPELQHEVQIPIVLTNSEYRNKKTKKSIREKVFGLGILHRYSRHESIDNFQFSSTKTNNNNEEPPQIRYADLDENFNEDFSIGSTSEPSYEEREEKRSAAVPRRNTWVADFGEVKRDSGKRSWVVLHENKPTKLEDVGLNDSVDSTSFVDHPHSCIRGRPSTPGVPRSVVGDDGNEDAESGARNEKTVLEGSDAFATSSQLGMHSHHHRICSSESGLATVGQQLSTKKDLESEVEDTHGSSDRMRVISHDWMKSFEENGEALFLDDYSPSSDQKPESPPEQSEPRGLGVRHSPDRRLPEVPIRKDSKLSDEDSERGNMGRGARGPREKIATGLYQNWMSMKSTKPARANPDTGSDLKVRFDFDVKEQTFFKDEMPKKSNFKALTSPRFQLKSRLRKSFRKCASSIVGRMRDRGSHKLSHDYEDLDVLDERVNELAKQSEQLCRNLMETAQKNVQCSSYATHFHQSSSLDGASPQTSSSTRVSPTPSNASYIDLSSYGSYLKSDETSAIEDPGSSDPKPEVDTEVMFLDTPTEVCEESLCVHQEKAETSSATGTNNNILGSQENVKTEETLAEKQLDGKS